MKRAWTDNEMKYLRKGIKEKETENANEWSWWLLFGAIVVMEVIVIGRIVSLF